MLGNPDYARFATGRKRKEDADVAKLAEYLFGSEEHKRRRFNVDEIYEDEGKERPQGELSRLQAEVEEHKHDKQDLLLDLLTERRQREKVEFCLRLEQVRHAHSFAAWQKEPCQKELRTAKDDFQKERIKRVRAEAAIKEGLQRELAMREHAQAAADGLNAEIEHLQNVNATTMSDLDELREIGNEDATKRRDEHIGLPPSYGNLDDEDRFPPYSTHEDGGTIEVALLKRETRQHLEIILTRSLNSEVEKGSKLELLGTLAGDLSKACDSFQKLLDIASGVPLSCVSKPFD
jgi:hypothetical protein